MVVRDCDPQDPEQVSSSNCCHSLIIIGSYQVNFADNIHTICCNIHTWSELLVHLVNMIKEGCGNKSALLIFLIYYLKNSQKSNLSLENKNLKWGEISL